MNIISIRTAKIQDLITLKHFEQKLILYERPFAHNLKKDPIKYYDLKKLIKQKNAEVVVAIYNNEIVGSGSVIIEKSIDYKNPEFYAYLGFMFVVPKYRGKKINSSIIKSLMKWSKDRGILEFQLDVYAENKNAIKAYQKLNFKSDLLKMRLNTSENI